MANLLQWRRASRTKRAGSVALDSRVSWAASLPSSCTAWRAAQAVARLRQSLAEGHGDAVGPAARRLPEKLSAREAKNAVPHAVQMNRDRGNVQSLEDLLHPPLERQQIAGARDRSFGKDADHVPGLQFPPGGLDRGGHGARSSQIHRYGPERAEHPAEGPMVVVRTPDHEPHVAMPRGPSDQKAVHQGDVIGYQQSAALRRHMACAQHPDAVQSHDQTADAEAHQSQRYHRNSVSRER